MLREWVQRKNMLMVVQESRNLLIHLWLRVICLVLFALRNKWLALCIWSLKFDPALATLYYRGRTDNRRTLSRQEWGIFLVATLADNFGWTIVVYIFLILIHFFFG